MGILGLVQILGLADERGVGDGRPAVARPTLLNYPVERSTKSLFGSITPGEGVVSVFEGRGRISLGPIESAHVKLRASLGAAVAGSTGSRPHLLRTKKPLGLCQGAFFLKSSIRATCLSSGPSPAKYFRR